MRQDRWPSPPTALLWSERQQGSSAQMKDTDSGDQSSCLSNLSLLHFQPWLSSVSSDRTSVTGAQCLFCPRHSLTVAFNFRQPQTSPSLTLSLLLRLSGATCRRCLTCVFQMGRQEGRFSTSRPGGTSLHCVPGEHSQNCLEREDGTSLGVGAMGKQSPGPSRCLQPLHFC